MVVFEGSPFGTKVPPYGNLLCVTFGCFCIHEQMQSTIAFASNNANYLNGHCPVIYRASQKRANRLLSLQNGSRFVRAAVACSILEEISGHLKQLLFVTVPSFFPLTP